MAFWRKLCCCIKENEINVDENTRLLPKSDGDSTGMKKIESDFTMYAFGVSPPGLHMRLIPQDFSRLGISKIACGSEHVLMLSETNYVIAAGNNEFGQCARDPTQALIRDENELEIPNESCTNLRMTAFNIDKFKIIDVAAGAYHSMVLVKPENSYNNSLVNKVMVFGHPLACGFLDNHYRFVPSEVFFENSRENIKNVYAGQMRCTVVTESNKIFAWGEWFTGTKQNKPKEILQPKSQNIKKIAVGKMFVMVLNHFGKVSVIGDNTYGELGLSRDIRNSFGLVEVPFFASQNVVDIAAGARHALVLNNEGKVFATGDNSEGQCGIEVARAYVPTEVPLKNVVGKATVEKVFCGDSHSMMINNDGELFAWGDNTAGRLGIKGNLSVFKPRIVEDVMGKYITNVGCGGIFTTILVGPSSFAINNKKNLVEHLAPPK